MTPQHLLTNHLLKIRIEKNLSQRQAAAQCKIHYHAYCKIEQGDSDVTVGLVRALSDGLGVDLFALMGIDLNQVPLYTCYEGNRVADDGEVTCIYGVAVDSQSGGGLCDSRTFTFRYADITTEKEKLESLIDCMNREQLYLLHAEDVIEDFIS